MESAEQRFQPLLPVKKRPAAGLLSCEKVLTGALKYSNDFEAEEAISIT